MVWMVNADLAIFPAQWSFRGDCPLRIFEYCLRFFADESIPVNKLHAVKYLLEKGLPETEIYKLLLVESGLFLVMAFVLVTLTAIYLNNSLVKKLYRKIQNDRPCASNQSE